jgi:hypothetical protein
MYDEVTVIEGTGDPATTLPFKTDVVQAIFKNPVRTAKKTEYITIAESIFLTMFK